MVSLEELILKEEDKMKEKKQMFRVMRKIKEKTMTKRLQELVLESPNEHDLIRSKTSSF